jgi:Spy/CpxP family protein refolding chaperone
MNPSRRNTLAGIFAAAGSLAAAGALAQGPRRHHGAMDPAHMEERIERFIKHVAVEVEATPEQTQKLTAIAQGAAKDLAPLRQKSIELRKQGLALFTAPSIDRAAVENLRVARMQQAEASSKRIAQALADAAEVLTPEQRKKAAERVGRWRHLG